MPGGIILFNGNGPKLLSDNHTKNTKNYGAGNNGGFIQLGTNYLIKNEK